MKSYFEIETKLTAVWEEIQELQNQPWSKPTPYWLQKEWAELAEAMAEEEALLKQVCL